MTLGKKIASLLGMKAKKSPVKLVCKRPWLDVGDDMLICKWKCSANIRGAQFRYRKRPDMFAILHRSTRSPGKWQLTHFDKDGPIGDVERSSCDEALYDGHINRDWKLEDYDA